MCPVATGTGSRQTSPANPQNWAPNKWHHIQIQSHRVGMLSLTTGVKTRQRQSAPLQESHRALWPFLGWTPPGVLLINFQVDGAYSSSGTIQGYFDKLQIWRW